VRARLTHRASRSALAHTVLPLPRPRSLLDELFDHGTTIHAIATALVKNADLRLKADDVFTCTLFSKHSGTKLAPPDLVGMNELPGVWLVGYGLDDAGEKRGWVHLFGCPKVNRKLAAVVCSSLSLILFASDLFSLPGSRRPARAR
jgi:hypothetical protein